MGDKTLRAPQSNSSSYSTDCVKHKNGRAPLFQVFRVSFWQIKKNIPMNWIPSFLESAQFGNKHALLIATTASCILGRDGPMLKEPVDMSTLAANGRGT